MPPSNSSVSSLVAEVSERLSSAVGDRGYPGVVAALLVVLLLLYFPFRLLKAGGEEKKTGAKEQATSEEETYPEPMPQGDMTVAELKRYDGSDPTVPVLVAAKGKVYDMTKGRDYYGKGAPYNCFAGIDCSRALAKVSLDKKDLNADCAGLFASERDVLNDWVRKFEDKYPFVGILVDSAYNGQ